MLTTSGQHLRKWLSLAAVLVVALLVSECAAYGQQVPQKPNILFILTDDQEPSTLAHMDALQRDLATPGIVFENTTNTFPLCCPSRAVIQTGMYPHNTGVLDNHAPLGGYGKFKDRGLQKDTVARWLDEAGYATGFFGKYMNEFDGAPPEGWDVLKAPADASKVDIVASSETLKFLSQERAEPFFAFAAFRAPHTPYYHADRYDQLFGSLQMPRTPDLNEADVSDKPAYVRGRPLLDESGMAELDSGYRKAVRSLQLVDEFIADSIALLEKSGKLDDTYIFYYTDNGIHTGYHRLGYGKRTPYQPDLGFPLIVRGRGLIPGKSGALVGNHDIASTIAELAGADVPQTVDGRSLVPAFDGDAGAWREAILIQGGGKVVPSWVGVRTSHEIFVNYKTGEHEYYDLALDPYQLQNSYARVKNTNPQLIADLESRLDALRSCKEERCRIAENGSGP